MNLRPVAALVAKELSVTLRGGGRDRLVGGLICGAILPIAVALDVARDAAAWDVGCFAFMVVSLVGACVVLTASLIAAGSLTIEREQRTVTLLASTPLGPGEIVLAKFLSSGLEVVLFVSCMAPTMAVTVIFGGVGASEAAAALAADVVAGLLATAMAISVSAMFRRSVEAVAVVVVVLLITVGGSLILAHFHLTPPVAMNPLVVALCQVPNVVFGDWSTVWSPLAWCLLLCLLGTAFFLLFARYLASPRRRRDPLGHRLAGMIWLLACAAGAAAAPWLEGHGRIEDASDAVRHMLVWMALFSAAVGLWLGGRPGGDPVSSRAEARRVEFVRGLVCGDLRLAAVLTAALGSMAGAGFLAVTASDPGGWAAAPIPWPPLAHAPVTLPLDLRAAMVGALVALPGLGLAVLGKVLGGVPGLGGRFVPVFLACLLGVLALTLPTGIRTAGGAGLPVVESGDPAGPTVRVPPSLCIGAIANVPQALDALVTPSEVVEEKPTLWWSQQMVARPGGAIGVQVVVLLVLLSIRRHQCRARSPGSGQTGVAGSVAG